MRHTITGLIILGLLAVTGCGEYQYKENSSAIEQKQTESNQMNLIKNDPPVQLKRSLERKNLNKRLTRINAENMTGCIYLVSYGSIIAFYPVDGKVSSLNSYLSGKEKIVDDPNGSVDAGSVLLESPDFDGAYGENVDGIFFFTADTDAYVEWKGEYLWSDQCLTPSQQPLMVRQITDNK